MFNGDFLELSSQFKDGAKILALPQNAANDKKKIDWCNGGVLDAEAKANEKIKQVKAF